MSGIVGGIGGGGIPAPHSPTHEDGGIDELDTTGLVGHVDAVHRALTSNPHSVSLEQARAVANALSGDIDANDNSVTGLAQLLAGTSGELAIGGDDASDYFADISSQNMALLPSDRTFIAAPGALFGLTGTYTHDYASVSFSALSLQATLEHDQPANLFNHFLLFNNGMTFKNVSGEANAFGAGQSFISQPTLQADGASVAMGQNRDFLSQPTYNAILGGALAVTTWTQFQAAGGIAAGATVTTRRGLWVQNLPVQTGTLTNEIGIEIDNLSMGGLVVGIRSALTAANGDFINSVGANAPARFGGEVEIDGALNHDGSAVGFYGSTPVVQPTVVGSRGGNAALASLLTFLASQGLIVDGSSA